MRQIRLILRLAQQDVSPREIGHTLGVARSTVRDGLERARAADLSWPLPADVMDEALQRLLFMRAGVKQGFPRRAPSRIGPRSRAS